MDHVEVVVDVGLVEGQDDVHHEQKVDCEVDHCPGDVVLVHKGCPDGGDEAREEEGNRHYEVPEVLELVFWIEHEALLPLYEV